MFKKRKSISIFQKTELQVQKVSTSSQALCSTELLKKSFFGDGGGKQQRHF